MDGNGNGKLRGMNESPAKSSQFQQRPTHGNELDGIEKAKQQMLEREKTFGLKKVVYDKKKMKNPSPPSYPKSGFGSSFVGIGSKAVYMTPETREKVNKEKRLSDEAEKRRLEGISVIPKTDWLSAKNEQIFNSFQTQPSVPALHHGWQWQNPRPVTVTPPSWQYKPAIAIEKPLPPKPINPPRPVLMTSGQIQMNSTFIPKGPTPNKLVGHPPAKKRWNYSTKSSPQNKPKSKAKWSTPKSRGSNSWTQRSKLFTSTPKFTKGQNQNSTYQSLAKWEPIGSRSPSEEDMDLWSRSPRSPIPKYIIRRKPNTRNQWEIFPSSQREEIRKLDEEKEKEKFWAKALPTPTPTPVVSEGNGIVTPIVVKEEKVVIKSEPMNLNLRRSPRIKKQRSFEGFTME